MRRYLFLLGALAPAAAWAADPAVVDFIGKTKYLNNAKAVVTHNIDDSTKYVPASVDAMDKYGIKSTIFISTDEDPAPEERFLTQLMVKDLWPRLRKAVADGHELGSHSQTHPCRRQETDEVCNAAYSDAEISGSRDEILKMTPQPYVWTWCYPCGTCANLTSIQQRIKAAGYIVARNYPDESHDGHVRPDLQTWADNWMNAAYTQVVQKRGGAAKTEILDVKVLNGKFDEIYKKGGIYNFMSHPQWLDYGPEGFYEKHLAYVGRRGDVWYVPMGPLYAYKTIYDKTEIKRLPNPGKGKAKFTVTNDLDRKVFGGSLTLEFRAAEGTKVLSNGKPLPERRGELTDRWNEQYFRREGDRLFVTVAANTTLEFRAIKN